jgi:hypothetical protein
MGRNLLNNKTGLRGMPQGMYGRAQVVGRKNCYRQKYCRAIFLMKYRVLLSTGNENERWSINSFQRGN